MDGTAESKLNAVRALVADPFHRYSALDERERRAAGLAVRGFGYRMIARMLGMSKNTAYRALDSAAAKIGEAIDRKDFGRADLIAHFYEQLAEVLK